MPLSRRRLLLASIGAGLAVPIIATAGRLDALLRAGARTVRPPSVGTTATRCAQCGAQDHGMLDPRCPAAPRVM